MKNDDFGIGIESKFDVMILKHIMILLKVQGMKLENINFLKMLKLIKDFGMGAPVKGNTLLNYFNIGVDIIDCLLEKNILRKIFFTR